MSSAVIKRSAQSLYSAAEFPVLLRSEGKQPYRTKPPVCRSATTVYSVCSSAASPLAHRHRVFCLGGLNLYACCDCVLVIKMTCAVNWIIVRERRTESTSLSRPDLAGSRGKTVSRYLEIGSDAGMTMTSVVSCHALHAPQHAVASPFGWLNQTNDFLRPSCRRRLYISGRGKFGYAGFCLELPTPRWTADQGLRAPSTLDIVPQIQLTAIQKQY